MAIQNLVVYVGLFRRAHFPPFFRLPYLGLILGRLFLVTSLLGAMFCLLWLLWYAVSTMRRPATQLLSNLQLCRQYFWPSVHFVERSPTNGTVPRNVFLCCLLLGECELPGSGVHLSVWLKSQDFLLRLRVQRVSLLSRVLPGFRAPHTKGSAGSTACQVYGTSTQKAPSQEPVEQLSQTTIVVESHPQRLLRGPFSQVSPYLPPEVSPQRGSLPSRPQRLRRACCAPSQDTRGVWDRISSSATRRKQDPLQHPAGSSEGCSHKTTRLEVDSPVALAFNKAEVVSVVSRRSCLRFLSCWGHVLSFALGLRVSRWKNNL